MKKFRYLFFVLLISINLLSAATTEQASKKLTHQMTEEEWLIREQIGKDFTPTAAPQGPIHQTAEFEKMQGVLVRYPFGIPVELIAEMSEDVVVTTIVANSSQENTVRNIYQSNSVNLDHCNFLYAASDSYWTRDYGPWFIIDGNGEFGIVDFPYNRPRPNDDEVAIEVADFLDINLFGMDIEHTGGNYMTDGYGKSASSDLVWNENTDLSHTQIANMMEDYLGVSEYFVVEDPNNTYIDHIDCWGKYLDVDKILIREVPTSHAQYNAIEETAQYFSEQISSYGTPYQVFRVYTPDNQPYTNSLILNDKVFVPITGSQWDDEAIATYESAMPGYEIIGVLNNTENPWESTDALHCRTRGIVDLGMLYIKHLPLFGDQPVQDEYTIQAEVIPYSGEALYSDSLRVYYSVNGGDYDFVTMSIAKDNTYSANIPGAAEGSTISYYIHAADYSGRSENNPFIGKADPHVFSVGLPQFPEITLDTTELNLSCEINHTVSTPFEIFNTGTADLNYTLSYSTMIFENLSIEIENSPSANSYNSNTLTEGNWKEFDITEEGTVSKVTVDFDWDTDNYPAEGSIWMSSPAENSAKISENITDGHYTIELTDFEGEDLTGTWKIWIADSYSDGGHQATNVSFDFEIAHESADWLTLSADNGIILPSESTQIDALCNATGLAIGDYTGKIKIESNDPNCSVTYIDVNLTVTDEEAISEDAPKTYLKGNSPNPFNPLTTIYYSLAEKSDVEITIYNVLGEKVKTLIKEKDILPGDYDLTWDGKDESGNSVASGVYFYKMNSTKKNEVRKMLLVK